MPFLNNAVVLEKSDNLKNTFYKILYESVEPIVLLCRITGLLPLLDVKKEKSIIMNLNDKDWMYFLVYIVLYLLMLLYNLKIVLNNEIFFYIDKSFQVVFIVVMLLYSITLIIFGYNKRNIINECLLAIAEVDSFLKNANLEMNYKEMKRKVLRDYLILLFLIAIRTLFFALITEIKFVQQLFLIMIPMLKFAFVFIYSTFVGFLSHRFDIINNTIKSFGDETVDEHNVSSYANKLYILCRSHFKLCGVAHKLGSNFGFQLLVTSIMMILNFLGQSYCFYALCTQNVTSGKAVKGIAIFTWFLTELLELYGLLVACTEACDNANEAPITLHEVQNKVENNELESHIQLFSLQMYHHKLVFSALGFFEIDFSLLYAIIGTVLTFLVIVVQFEQSQTPPSNIVNVVTEFINATISTISSDIVAGDYYDDEDYDYDFDF